MRFNKEQPIYQQIIDDIKVKIVNGTYSTGFKLPSIREYAEEMLVNPNTVQKAFSELEREDYIHSKRGIGFFVNEDEELINKLKKKYLNDEVDVFIEKMSSFGFSKSEIIEKVKEKLWLDSMKFLKYIIMEH